MDSKGNVYLDPTLELVRRLDLKPIRRSLTEMELKEKKIMPNSACGCGSGKKFKKCCYRKQDRVRVGPVVPFKSKIVNQKSEMEA